MAIKNANGVVIFSVCGKALAAPVPKVVSPVGHGFCPLHKTTTCIKTYYSEEFLGDFTIRRFLSWRSEHRRRQRNRAS